jgi:hypothetical protein
MRNDKFKYGLIWIFRFRITQAVMCALLFFVLIPALMRDMGVINPSWFQASYTFGGILIVSTAIPVKEAQPKRKDVIEDELVDEFSDDHEAPYELCPHEICDDEPQGIDNKDQEENEMNRIVTYKGKRWLCPSANTDVKNN